MTLDIQLRKSIRAADRSFELDVAFRSDAPRMVLFGPSGAGKSLTLQAIAGLITPDAGRIVFNGRVLFDSQAGVRLPPQQRRVAYLFQDYALFPHLTVAQNIGFGLRSGCWPLHRPERHPLVRQWMNAFRIENIAASYPLQLSGGQRQRVALARALVASPDLLLLDEPFAALDQSLRQHMREELREMQQRLKLPMLTITHDPADVAALGDVVFNMQDGRIVEPAALQVQGPVQASVQA
ncbi:ATP-binding cassette domain-containing protein [Oxalobacteraceae bacterium CAVE-383]|nr:ATP-binding cassette domain-containing protein [Oxalobacteraceae bacterium CAVE-383]